MRRAPSPTRPPSSPSTPATSNVAAPSVAVSVTDDEAGQPGQAGVPGVTVAAADPLSVDEGDSAAYTVVLDAEPTADVVIAITSDNADVTVQPASLTFTTGNWETAQTVTVSAAQDEDAADDAATLGHAVSGAGEYAGIAVASVAVGVTDDDAATVEPQPAWTLKLVREDRPFETVAEGDADAAYPSTFLKLERGSSTAPIPDWLPVTVGGTAANPADYEFNQGNRFTTVNRKSDDLMRGARKITVKADGLDEEAETITFSVTIEGETLTATLTVVDDVGLAVADASVEEAAGASLDFRVTLARALSVPVTVDWTTADGSAVAGQDYQAASGRLTFAAGETEKTISVAVLDDAHDEGSETMTLMLSNPSPGAVLADAEAVGAIGNTDLMPRAWLARFGRTVADQVIDAVTGRLKTAPKAGSGMRIGGQAVGAGGSPGAWEACAAWRAERWDRRGLDIPETGGRAGSGIGDPCRSGTRTLSGQELLTGSSFAFTGGNAETGFGTLWGSGAVTRFDGREGGLTLEGDVASAVLGADFVRGRATVGLAVAHSRGEGGYSGSGQGDVESTLTGFYPYGRYEVSKRLSLWGVVGYGAGTLTLRPEGGARAETDTDMTMAAAGAGGVLVEAPARGGVELAAKTDGLLLRISSDSARDGAGGLLAASEADVTRLRFGLEGAWRGGAFTPTFELGLRHDGGDAGTGFGVEAGAGFAWSDPAMGIRAELKVRGLLAHEAEGFRELGLSGSFAWDPTPASDRGPSLTLTQTMGASASGGVDALFGSGAPAVTAAHDAAGGLDARRFEAKLAYGVGAFGERFTLTPEAVFGLSNESRTYGLGWRLNPSGGDRSFELRLDGTRREADHDDTPEHSVELKMTARW